MYLCIMKRIKHIMEIPNDVKLIHQIFKESSFDIYIVGGAVRDSYLGLKPKDYDLVSNLSADSTIELLKPYPFVKNILETGKAFGVINVITDEGEYELAVFRSDGEYSDSRRPDSVTFGSMEDDSKRRDLTCNYLYYNISTEEIIDLNDGINNINKNVINTVGNPEDRFKEDRLRILRILRFTCRFGSELEPSVDAALQKDASLKGISGERIRDEFLKGIKSAKSVKKFLTMIDKYGLFDWIFTGLNVNKDFIEDSDPLIVISGLLKNNNIDLLNKTLNMLKYSAEEVKSVVFLVALLKLSLDTAFNLKKAQKYSGVWCT